MADRIESVPTNIVTGFMGVGKTTAILHLLEQKPASERWAVLVNEFGEVGIDGGLFAGDERSDKQVFLKEVPGGCMCCAAGLPMQVALNTLIAQAKPHRLLIEPTGLGHPREVLEVLGAEHYREVIDLRATITMIDARKVHDERYTTHPTFLQQLDIADVLVANKTDTYDSGDFEALRSFLERTVSLEGRSLFSVENGALEPDWLHPEATRYTWPEAHHHHESKSAAVTPKQAPPGGHVRYDNEGEGFISTGWIFDSSFRFEAASVRNLLLGVDAERIKGVLITEDGILGLNMVDGVLSEIQLDESMDSRLEFIGRDREALAGLEDAILGCATKL